MKTLTFPALVLNECDYLENDKLITVLTAEHGRMTITAKGAKSLRNQYMVCTQRFIYAEFTVNERGGRYTLTEASLINQFFGISGSLGKSALASYIVEVASAVTVENADEGDMLSLCLNTLYMLTRDDVDLDYIKGVFELRCAVVQGFCPELSGCSVCEKEDHPNTYLDVMNGSLVCGDCFGSEDTTASPQDISGARIIVPLSRDILEMMRYTVSCSPKRIFSLSAPPELTSEFGAVCEKYLINQLGRSFYTLDFFKKVKEL